MNYSTWPVDVYKRQDGYVHYASLRDDDRQSRRCSNEALMALALKIVILVVVILVVGVAALRIRLSLIHIS